ncbi:unnamed protein product, partial [Ectocarpus sp. 13 AM-2016]
QQHRVRDGQIVVLTVATWGATQEGGRGGCKQARSQKRQSGRPTSSTCEPVRLRAGELTRVRSIDCARLIAPQRGTSHPRNGWWTRRRARNPTATCKESSADLSGKTLFGVLRPRLLVVDQSSSKTRSVSPLLRSPAHLTVHETAFHFLLDIMIAISRNETIGCPESEKDVYADKADVKSTLGK